jgi:beta-1,4-mannooligosaccharide/beta-1,4-mannosyl-N-acetylglucosamine phosphorylase
VILLDLRDPTRVLGRCRANILEPREIYELVGQVPNVVFPSGLVVEETDAEGFARPESEVKIYYGAADTVVGLATTTVAELLAAAREAALDQAP